MREQVTSWVVRASISPLHREGTRQWSPLNTVRRKVESNSMFSTVLRARKGFSSLLSFAPCSTDSSSAPSTISQLDCRAHKSMTMLWQEMSGVRARAGSRRQQLMWSSNSLIVFFPFSLSSLGLFQVSVTQERRHRLSFIHKKLAVKHKRALNSSSPNGIPLSFDEIITLLKKTIPQTNQPSPPKKQVLLAGSCPGRAGITFTWLYVDYVNNFIQIAAAFFHVRFVSLPISGRWYQWRVHTLRPSCNASFCWLVLITCLRQATQMHDDDEFPFLKQPCTYLHRGGLVSSQEKKKNHAAKCRPCIFSIVTWNNFTVPFRESFSTDFWLGIPKHICTAGILKCMRSVKAVNLEVHGKEVGGWCSNRGRSFYFKIDWWMPLK